MCFLQTKRVNTNQYLQALAHHTCKLIMIYVSVNGSKEEDQKHWALLIFPLNGQNRMITLDQMSLRAEIPIQVGHEWAIQEVMENGWPFFQVINTMRKDSRVKDAAFTEWLPGFPIRDTSVRAKIVAIIGKVPKELFEERYKNCNLEELVYQKFFSD